MHFFLQSDNFNVPIRQNLAYTLLTRGRRSRP
jgi:hypothetical protein